MYYPVWIASQMRQAEASPLHTKIGAETRHRSRRIRLSLSESVLLLRVDLLTWCGGRHGSAKGAHRDRTITREDSSAAREHTHLKEGLRLGFDCHASENLIVVVLVVIRFRVRIRHLEVRKRASVGVSASRRMRTIVGVVIAILSYPHRRRPWPCFSAADTA